MDPIKVYATVMMRDNSAVADHWLAFAKALGDIGRQVHELTDASRTAEQRGEIDQALFNYMTVGAMCLLRMDPDYPDWHPVMNSTFHSLNPCPDYVYYLSRIRGSGVYRLTGQRGTVRMMHLQVGVGFIGFSTLVASIGDFDIDDFELDQDGGFEIILSAVRPAGYEGNWIKLDAQADDTFLLMRQIAYDWLHEKDGHFTIQRIDQSISQPRRSAEDIARRLSQVPIYIERAAQGIINTIKKQQAAETAMNCINDVTNKFAAGNLVANQGYSHGEIMLGFNEALIVQVDKIPESCRYWSVQLMDSFYNALDWMYHQSGLNGHNAKVDPDGKVRFVVSPRDPGAPNWLDKGDYEKNSIRFRWYNSIAPAITTKKVDLSEVRDYLFPGTSTISPEQRQEALRNRAAGAQSRRRW